MGQPPELTECPDGAQALERAKNRESEACNPRVSDEEGMEHSASARRIRHAVDACTGGCNRYAQLRQPRDAQTFGCQIVALLAEEEQALPHRLAFARRRAAAREQTLVESIDPCLAIGLFGTLQAARITLFRLRSFDFDAATPEEVLIARREIDTAMRQLNRQDAIIRIIADCTLCGLSESGTGKYVDESLGGPKQPCPQRPPLANQERLLERDRTPRRR